jgi:hypothetical protein
VPTLEDTLALNALAVLCTALAFITFFALIAHALRRARSSASSIAVIVRLKRDDAEQHRDRRVESQPNVGLGRERPGMHGRGVGLVIELIPDGIHVDQRVIAIAFHHSPERLLASWTPLPQAKAKTAPIF